jgi:hypothetical protein
VARIIEEAASVEQPLFKLAGDSLERRLTIDLPTLLLRKHVKRQI